MTIVNPERTKPVESIFLDPVATFHAKLSGTTAPQPGRNTELEYSGQRTERKRREMTTERERKTEREERHSGARETKVL